jgi:Tfp pilus assembly protein PilV
MKTSMNSKSRSAFTLIEIALAILLIALGILAMFSLLGAGLDTSNKASADAQAAIFADSVFNSLRAESQRAAEAELNNAHPESWTNFWISFKDGTTNIPVAFTELWESNMVIRGDGLQTAVFGNVGTHIVNHALRYTIAVQPRSRSADVLLNIWDGQFGQTGDTNALIFYSEFRKEGDL